MVELYKNEDKRFGVTFNDGILNNGERPLFPEISYLKQKYGDLVTQQQGLEMMQPNEKQHIVSNT